MASLKYRLPTKYSMDITLKEAWPLDRTHRKMASK